MSRSGGCQCGAVRFRVTGDLGRASLCHCRMCQKAFAAPFGALVTVSRDQLVWTRGEPVRFQSSNKAARGFCSACGTPLTFEWSAQKIDLAVLAFDDAASIPIAAQLRVEAALPWVMDLAGIPSDAGASGEGLVSHQHPDHN
jgi:hypothetical protein